MKSLTPIVVAALFWGVAIAQSPPPSQSTVEPPLLTAARKLDVPKVRLLLADGTGVGSRSDRAESALHLVLSSGDSRPESRTARFEIVEALLHAGHDACAADRDGLCPLHVAALKGRDEAIPALLAAKADPAAVDNSGRIALHYAAMGNHKAVMEQLLAIRTGGAESSENGARAAKAAYVDARDKLGETPLHVAARRFRTHAAERLIAAGADVNARNVRNQTPLQLLCMNKGERVGPDALIEFARLVLSRGAGVNARDEAGKTALTYAIESEAPELADLLRTNGGVQ